MGSNERRRRKFKRQIIILFVALVALILGGVFLYKHLSNTASIKAHLRSPAGVRTPSFILELALTDSSRSRGLMWRKSLPKGTGMLFIYPSESNHSFWMKNTYVSLDLIFVDKRNKVVGTLKNLPILEEKSKSIGKPSIYIIEAPAGTVDAHGIGEDWELVFEQPVPQAY